MSLNTTFATNPTKVLGPSGHMEIIFQGTVGSLGTGHAYEQHLGLCWWIGLRWPVLRETTKIPPQSLSLLCHSHSPTLFLILFYSHCSMEFTQWIRRWANRRWGRKGVGFLSSFAKEETEAQEGGQKFAWRLTDVTGLIMTQTKISWSLNYLNGGLNNWISFNFIKLETKTYFCFSIPIRTHICYLAAWSTMFKTFA